MNSPDLVAKFDFITERIAVGQKIDTAEFVEVLRQSGITHVINLFGDNVEQFWVGKVLHLPQEDDGSRRDPEQIRKAIIFAFEALSTGGKLYLHCQWGLGRAPAMCYAILRAVGLEKEWVIAQLERRRPRCATWNWKQYIPSIESALGGAV